MKLLLISTLAFFLLQAFANPIAEEDDARLKIKAAYAIGEKIIEAAIPVIRNKQTGQFLRTLTKSIDLECVFLTYKKHDLLDDLMEEAELMQKIDEMQTSGTKDKQLMRLAAIAITCSTKIDPILKYIFDSVAATAELAHAFREDPPVDEIYEKFICYYNYAIDHGLGNAGSHGNLSHPLLNQTQEECNNEVEGIINMVTTRIKAVKSSDPIIAVADECFNDELIAYAHNLLFKASILLQAELSDNQKALERKSFVSDFHSSFEKIVFCEVSTRKNATLHALN